MLFDPKLLKIVRDETRPTFENGQVQNTQYLDQDYPRLNGICHGTIRMTAYASSVRYITKDTITGGKILRKGNRAMMPNRQLHFDHDVYGKDADEFRATRYVEDKSLLRSPSWRAFGCGVTACPGQLIANQTAISFVAMLVQRYDIRLASPQRMLRLEEGNPVLGIIGSKDGEELLIKLKPLKSTV